MTQRHSLYEMLLAEGIVLTRIDDATAHVSPGGSQPPDPFRYVRGALPDEPGVVAIDHPATKAFVLTTHEVTPCLPSTAPTDPRDVGNAYDVTMGYTALRIVEKRAVAHRGKLLRLWPGDRGTGERVGLLVAPNSFGNLWLQTSSTTWHAVQKALDLSSRMEWPVVMTSEIDECDWH